MPRYQLALALSSKASFSDIWSDIGTYKPETLDSAVETSRSTQDYRFGKLRVDWADIHHRSRMSPLDKQKDSEDSIKRVNASMGVGHNALTATFHPVTEANVLTSSSIVFGTTTLPEGMIRLFRHIQSPNAAETTAPQDDGTILCVLAVPSYMTPSDFLTFIAPAEEGLAHLRLIRDVSENRSVALLRFRGRDYAEEFAQEYNGRLFNSLEPESCHIVRITAVTIDATDNSLSGMLQTPVRGLTDIYELPTCPVCLERMDSAVTGLVTIPCSHSFHCMCLSKWGDSRCPVCRYSQSLLTTKSRQANSSRLVSFPPADNASVSMCSSCSSTINLWICLICGNVGCGRYGQAHAFEHYTQTTHLYALELETQRVWDYAGDGYVHRLIQNRADGKLVELPSASAMAPSFGTSQGRTGPTPADSLAAEKVEAIGIEYSYLLTSQLDSQRSYYEKEQAQLSSALSDAHDRILRLEDEVVASDPNVIKRLEERARRAEARAERLQQSARNFEAQLKEEKLISSGFLENIGALKKRAEAADQEKDAISKRLQECEEQLRDIMFYLETKEKIEKGAETGESLLGEAAGGTIVLPPAERASKVKRPKKKV
ncbi:uncharacterized protein EI90DRAFT_2974435 [Cantharellus anzutake]|uniref:uncharacterized protein n=1 Tax=Cantharellus anzutake TaxID=1750568 RepID=UPI0019088E15|nr:uncharacterized protein EI90DRAFT_2974435 [Cantharellus anzutake]KAF8328404.1 hypothetical protein EI90DRAFT_2974435 [Cantharellus anzutake]